MKRLNQIKLRILKANGMYAWVKPVLFLLFFILIVTSYMVGYLLGNKTIEPSGQIIDTIVLSPDEEDYSKVPIHISSKIKQNNGKPYANHIVQLHSKVREVLTDDQGRFMFENSGLGNHELILLDDDRNTIIEKKILFRRTSNFGQVDFPDESEEYFAINMGRDVKLLECSLDIDEKTGNIVLDRDKTVVLTNDGSMITSKGYSNLSKGVLITPNGIVVSLDGTMISPTGQIILPDNTTQTVGEKGYTTSDGTQVFADGTVLLTNGTTVSKDGVIKTPDGKTQKVSEGGNTISDGSGGAQIDEVTPRDNNDKNKPDKTVPVANKKEDNKPEDNKTVADTNKPVNKDTPIHNDNKEPSNKGDASTENKKQEDNIKKPDSTTTEKPSTESTEEPPTTESPTTQEPPKETEPDTDSGSGGGGGGPVVPDTQSEPIEAFEGNESWKNLAHISLFTKPDGSENTIMPGSNGYYIFRLKNGNPFDLFYSLTIDDSQNYKFKLPLLYRLKRGDQYLGGKKWMKPEELKDVAVELEKKGDVYYTLEWLWPFESGQDEEDTRIGMLDEADRKYIVTLTILAQEK